MFIVFIETVTAQCKASASTEMTVTQGEHYRPTDLIITN